MNLAQVQNTPGLQLLGSLKKIDQFYHDYSRLRLQLSLQHEKQRLIAELETWKNQKNVLQGVISQSKELEKDLELCNNKIKSTEVQIKTVDCKVETIESFEQIIEAIKATKAGGEHTNVINLHNNVSFLNPEGNQLKNAEQNDPVEFIDKTLEYDSNLFKNYQTDVSGLEDTTYIHCGECDNLLKKKQLLWCLTLKDEIARQLNSIQAMVNYYVKPVTLIDYICDKCKSSHNMLIWHKLELKTDNLIIRVPRINENGVRSKKSYYINAKIDVAASTVHLKGELKHYGTCINSGHFTFTRIGKKQDINIDDAKITYGNKPASRSNSNCYILVYQR